MRELRDRVVREVIHSHPVKKDTDIVACVRHGVQWFTFDNPDEIPKLRLHAPDAGVLLRVAIKNDNCVVDLGAKYGVHPDEALSLILQARAAGVERARHRVPRRARSPRIPASISPR